MSSICIQPLGRDKIAKAYGLMRLAMPSLSFNDWTAYAKDRLPVRGGPGRILTAEDCQAYLLGLACFDTRRTLRFERELVVEELMAPGLFQAQVRAVTAGLLEACEKVAADLSCGRLRLEVGRPVWGAGSEAIGWLLRAPGGPAMSYPETIVARGDIRGHA